MELTKRNVKKILGLKSDSALSRYFDLSRGAAFFWNEDAPIPKGHQMTLLRKRPDLAEQVLSKASN